MREGYSRRYVRIGGRWRDHVRLALLVEDWRDAPQETAVNRGKSRPRAHLFAVLSLCACTALPHGEAPIDVHGREIPPYEAHEECFRLQIGDRVEFAFESTEPVDFNFHYHEGNAVVMPLAREKCARMPASSPFRSRRTIA